MEQKNHLLICVLTDSIDNSVFVSQVFTPLLKRKKQGNFSRCMLISFERNLKVIPQEIESILRKSNITCKLFTLPAYLGMRRLYPQIKQLTYELKNYSNYTLIARGPLAGYLAMQAVQTDACKNIIIQARGLCAEEYAYTNIHNAKKTTLSWIIHAMRYRLFKKIESCVYGQKINTCCPVEIEAVSPALADYLITKFYTPKNILTLASIDLPATVDKDQRTAWSLQKRTELGFAATDYIYVYCGSYKPWQCPDQMIAFFKKQYAQNRSNKLLILSQDTKPFSETLVQAKLPADAYRVISKPHKEVMQYLAAAHCGLLFRQSHIINWVSRPTKALEYQAVGLKVEHNNTVEYLAHCSYNNGPDIKKLNE